MNTLKATALSLTALVAVGLYSAPAMSAMVDATQAWFQYGSGTSGSSGTNTTGLSGNVGTTDNRHLDANAIDSSTSTFRSLGLNGMGVFGFGSEFSGKVTIWEATFGSCSNNGGVCDHWKEAVDVYAGTADLWDGTGDFSGIDFKKWTSLGTLGNADAQGGGSPNGTLTGSFTWLLLVDKGLTSPNPPDGFDVAKVSASTVPIPAAAWLFGSALLGLAGVARRRKSAQV